MSWRRKWQPIPVLARKNYMDLQVTTHGVAKSGTWLSDWAHTHPQREKLFHTVIRSPSQNNEARKKPKGIQIGRKEVKLSLFADDMTLYIQNPKDAIKKLKEIINKHIKLQGTKSTHKNLLHFYMLTMSYQKETWRSKSHLQLQHKI